MIFLISKKLLEYELDKAMNGLHGNEAHYYCTSIEKELELLNKLDIEIYDMIGSAEEFSERLNNSEIIIMPKGTYKKIVENEKIIKELCNFMKGRNYILDKEITN